MKSRILASLLLLILCAAFTQVQDQWKILDDEKYSIHFPGDWELNQSDQFGTSFFLFSPLGADDQFRENVNLIIEDLTGLQIDLDAYTELADGQLKTVIGEFNLLESKRKKANGQSYHMVLYTGTIDGMSLKIAQHFYVANEKAYVLTFTGEREHFDEFQETGELIMESFVLK